jgi:hypothetical protein
MAIKGVGFQEAVRLLGSVEPLSRSTRPPVPSPEAPDLSPSASENPPFAGQYQKYFVPSDWLAKRAFEPRTLEHFGVGEYNNPARASAYKGKILLPVKRWKDSQLVGYLARNPNPGEGEPKYVWPKGFHKSLEVFGAVQLRDEHELPLRIVYLVESPLAVMKFWQLGIPAVSCFGWTVSPEQAAIINELAKGIVFLPDANKRKEAHAFAGLLSERVWVKMPEFGLEDPKLLSAEQIRSLA